MKFGDSLTQKVINNFYFLEVVFFKFILEMFNILRQPQFVLAIFLFPTVKILASKNQVKFK